MDKRSVNPIGFTLGIHTKLNIDFFISITSNLFSHMVNNRQFEVFETCITF